MSILLIGAGRMGSALLKGWLDRGIKSISVVEPKPSAPLRKLAKAKKIALFAVPSSVQRKPSVCVVAIKPQVLKGEAATLAGFAQGGALMISIAAGTSIEALTQAWGRKARIIRAMPNMPEFAAADRPLTLLHQPNSGVAAARNTGIAAAQGTLIAPIDADDLWAASYLEQLVQRLLESPPTVGVVYAWSVEIDEQDAPIGGFQAAQIEGWVYPTLLCHNFLGNASATLIRRARLDQVGGYPESLRLQQAQGCEDLDLYLRLARVCEFRVVPAFLVQYRQQTQSMSRCFETMTRSQSLVLASQDPPPPGWLLAMAQSSFYLLIARRCSGQGDWAAAQHWVRSAYRVDPLSRWLRPGSRWLAWKSAANQTHRRLPTGSAPGQWPDRRAVQRRLWASSGLHWVLKTLVGGAGQRSHQPLHLGQRLAKLWRGIL